jgi:hypothetical protein
MTHVNVKTQNLIFVNVSNVEQNRRIYKTPNPIDYHDVSM